MASARIGRKNASCRISLHTWFLFVIVGAAAVNQIFFSFQPFYDDVGEGAVASFLLVEGTIPTSPSTDGHLGEKNSSGALDQEETDTLAGTNNADRKVDMLQNGNRDIGGSLDGYTFATLDIKGSKEEAYHQIDAVDGMTVIVSVFRQPKCLQQMVQYLRLCGVVHEIRVNWFEDEAMLHEIPQSYFLPANTSSFIPNPRLASLHFDVLPNNISYRFFPRPVQTKATFHVDVDTMYSCRALEFAYQTWVDDFGASNQTVLGFHPRYLKPNGRFYSFSESFQRPFRYNTVFATKGALMHRSVMNVFFSDHNQPTDTTTANTYESLRYLVDQHITAEDMLMSFVLATNQVNTVALCVEPEDTCAIACMQGQQVALSKRTSDIRPKLLDAFIEYFAGTKAGDTWNNDQRIGNYLNGTNATLDFLLPNKVSADQMIWLNHTVKGWNHRCYSAPVNRRSISVANRKCKWFCANTPVCPQNPRRKHRADTWEEPN